MTQRRDLFLIALLAIAANFTYLAASNGDFTFPDSITYLTPAKSLLHARGFLDDTGRPDALRTPIYPLFLIPFVAMTNELAPIVAVQHLINVALAMAIYLFVRRRLQSRFVALLAAIVFAVDTPSIHYANKVLSETLFTAALFAVFVLQHRAAILAGALTLIRPVAVAYFIVVAIFSVRRRIALFLVIGALFPLAWAVRNRLETGVFTLSSVAGINMLAYRAAGAIAILDGGEFKDDLRDRQQELLDDAEDDEELPPAIRARKLGIVGRRIALQHPIGLALVTARGLLVNLFDSDWEAMMLVSPLDSSLVRLAIDAWTHAVILLAIIGVIVMWNRDRQLAAMIAATALYFLVMSAGGEAEARFRVPVMPQIAIAAAFGVDAIRRAAASPAPR